MDIKSIIHAHIVNLAEARIAAGDAASAAPAVEVVVATIENAAGPMPAAFFFGVARGVAAALPLAPFVLTARLVGGRLFASLVGAALAAATEETVAAASAAAWVRRKACPGAGEGCETAPPPPPPGVGTCVVTTTEEEAVFDLVLRRWAAAPPTRPS